MEMIYVMILAMKFLLLKEKFIIITMTIIFALLHLAIRGKFINIVLVLIPKCALNLVLK